MHAFSRLSPRLALAATLLGASVLGGGAPAYAATGSLYARAITLPAGVVKMGTHLWVADGANGFCRLDPQAVPAGTFAINPAVCTPKAVKTPGQAVTDGSNLYVSDGASGSPGVWRLAFDSLNEVIPAGATAVARAAKGRTRADDRKILNGILWVLGSGGRWADLPDRYGAASTCHLRLQQWQRHGVWERLCRVLQTTRGDLPGRLAPPDATVRMASPGAAQARGGRGEEHVAPG